MAKTRSARTTKAPELVQEKPAPAPTPALVSQPVKASCDDGCKDYEVKAIGLKAVADGLDSPTTIHNVCDESEAIRRFIIERRVPESSVSNYAYRAAAV